MMASEPTLVKRPADPHGREYQPLMWDWFLRLRAWARWIAWREQATVCLAGSALEKPLPRDVDVAIIWPAAEFERRFGPVPAPDNQEAMKRFWERQVFHDARLGLTVSAWEGVGFKPYVDVRLCPDTWWPDKDRLVLAAPAADEPPSQWGEHKFFVRDIVR